LSVEILIPALTPRSTAEALAAAPSEKLTVPAGNTGETELQVTPAFVDLKQTYVVPPLLPGAIKVEVPGIATTWGVRFPKVPVPAVQFSPSGENTALPLKPAITN
jgi:hypothetical protein